MMGEGLGKLALGAILAGLYVYVLMAFFAVVKGQPVDIYKFFAGNGLDGYNLAASIAAFVVALGIVLELVNAAYSYGAGIGVGHDPWGGATLEWFALSPPQEHNFDALPDVRSAEPLHDIRRAIRDRTESWRPPPPRTDGEEAPEREVGAAEDAGAGDASGGAAVA
jgi:cytochrome c oxidase subunit 1